jgi:hypothetical protein
MGSYKICPGDNSEMKANPAGYYNTCRGDDTASNKGRDANPNN